MNERYWQNAALCQSSWRLHLGYWWMRGSGGAPDPQRVQGEQGRGWAHVSRSSQSHLTPDSYVKTQPLAAWENLNSCGWEDNREAWPWWDKTCTFNQQPTSSSLLSNSANKQLVDQVLRKSQQQHQFSMILSCSMDVPLAKSVDTLPLLSKWLFSTVRSHNMSSTAAWWQKQPMLDKLTGRQVHFHMDSHLCSPQNTTLLIANTEAIKSCSQAKSSTSE